MNIHIDGQTERLIQSALASGEFSSAEDFVAAMANRWKKKRTQAGRSKADEQSALTAFSKLGVIGCMKPGDYDLATNPEHIEGFGR